MESEEQNTSSIELDETLLELYIRGLEVYYSAICPTKLWLFSHNLGREHESEYVILGRILHEKYYRRYIRNIHVDEKVSIDFISYRDRILIHEVKRSDVAEEADRLQVLYYILTLLNKGVSKVYGVIHYPRRKKKVRIYLDKDGYRRLIKQLEYTAKIKDMDSMPKPMWKKICRRCSYREFCWVDTPKNI